MQFREPHWIPTSCGGLLPRTPDFQRLPTAVISTRPQSACAWRLNCSRPSTTRSKWTGKLIRSGRIRSVHGPDTGPSAEPFEGWPQLRGFSSNRPTPRDPRITNGHTWGTFDQMYPYEGLWLATTHDALNASSGAISIPASPQAPSRHIGQEVDITAQYQVSKGITTGFGYARLFSGRFLKTVSPGKDYGYPFVYLTYGPGRQLV